MPRLRLACALVASCLLLAAGPVRAAEQASADDTAKFLAGMQPSAGSPLAPLTQERVWRAHAAAMNRVFAAVEKGQLTRIRDWASEQLKMSHPTMYYMFSGPDFLYANAFFPKAATYVLSGLEPVGQIPDMVQLQKRRGVGPALNHLHHSMQSLLSHTFFITKAMRADLDAGSLRGTLPVLYVFLARAGKHIRDVALISLDGEGAMRPDPDGKAKSAAHGVKIEFLSAQGRAQTLYYFNTDLANGGVRKSGFLKFCEVLAPGDSFLKSASYLLHHGDFSRVREFLLDHSALILQDDSGIPLRYFEAKKWALHPFGHYLGPIEIFPGNYQDKMRELYRKGHPGKINFGVGYRWRPGESNLLLAIDDASVGQRH